jgi:hypothetical protein
MEVDKDEDEGYMDSETLTVHEVFIPKQEDLAVYGAPKSPRTFRLWLNTTWGLRAIEKFVADRH